MSSEVNDEEEGKQRVPTVVKYTASPDFSTYVKAFGSANFLQILDQIVFDHLHLERGDRVKRD